MSRFYDIKTTVTGPVTVDSEDLRILFDLAINSLDFGSGWWDWEDKAAGQKIAIALGIDPESVGLGKE